MVLASIFTDHTTCPPIIGRPYFIKSRRSCLSVCRRSLTDSRSFLSAKNTYPTLTLISSTREISVAMAAPFTPRAGKPSLPKISI